MVTVDVPVVAVLLPSSVRALVPVVLSGRIPGYAAGKPDAERLTLP